MPVTGLVWWLRWCRRSWYGGLESVTGTTVVVVGDGSIAIVVEEVGVVVEGILNNGRCGSRMGTGSRVRSSNSSNKSRSCNRGIRSSSNRSSNRSRRGDSSSRSNSRSGGGNRGNSSSRRGCSGNRSNSSGGSG